MEGVIKIENIGITHNFFDVGGNSLLAIRIVSDIKEQLDITVEPIHIMEFPNIRALAKFMAERSESINVSENPNPKANWVRKQDFSKIQKRRK